MPSVAQSPITVSSAGSRKRRREDGDVVAAGVGGAGRTENEALMKLHSSSSNNNNTPNRRPYDALPHLYATELRDSHPHSHRVLLSPRRKTHDLKRQRIGLGVGGRDVYLAFNPFPAEPQPQPQSQARPRAATATTVDLRPCHVCRRKPTVRAELDAFGDCECCGARTCYICARRCEGPGLVEMGRGEGMVLEEGGRVGRKGAEMWEMGEAHREMICSACCVERGADGEVWCLGCLRTEQEVETEAAG